MRVSNTLLISLFYEPGTSHIAGIENRAIQAMELGMISELPKITVAKSEKTPFWHLKLEVKDEDRPFWFGFYLGKDFCINNRPITVGCD